MMPFMCSLRNATNTGEREREGQTKKLTPNFQEQTDVSKGKLGRRGMVEQRTGIQEHTHDERWVLHASVESLCVHPELIQPCMFTNWS